MNSSLKKKWCKWTILWTISIFAIGLAVSWLIGTYLISKKSIKIENLAQLNVNNINFKTADGIKINGWYVPGKIKNITIILLHGYRGNRMDMADRAKFLNDYGYSVLLFDFRANGESDGDYTTSGYLESNEVRSSIDFIKSSNGSAKIVMVGDSMGASALSMAGVDKSVAGMVFEQMYPELSFAIKNRMADAIGSWSTIFSPLLTCQIKFRFGFSVDDVSPIKFVPNISCPKLFMVADKDTKTTLSESMNLYSAAENDKQLVVFEGAKHQDLLAFDPVKYQKVLIDFINKSAQ